LNLPTYTGPDHIIRVLMTSLADTPASFDTMMARLETLTGANPWMNSVITKLKAGSPHLKAGFVTAMANTSLRMRFSLIGYNKATETWYMKVKNTNAGSVADSIRAGWKNNFETSGIMTRLNKDGELVYNQAKVQQLL